MQDNSIQSILLAQAGNGSILGSLQQPIICNPRLEKGDLAYSYCLCFRCMVQEFRDGLREEY